ncbi:uncharacterized protein LOC132193584 isoform X2 [Neocloeon triangulifer]|uniref:uncharacterized protein LOC132193584 isoform X2 n=1 Tax=Neocloeon triangulifer TaxID=2078957 RepID=UPI00286F2EBC|nr:uncharacterized protein LOC132193584 isoform X2 [Neocloeon triangulifer]
MKFLEALDSSRAKERMREHLNQCWRMDWCRRLLRKTLEDLNQEHLMDSLSNSKRDVFTSRGWAAGGLPSHFASNRKNQQQQPEMNTNNRQPRFSALQGLNPGVALIADSRIYEEDPDANEQLQAAPQKITQPKVENSTHHNKNYSGLPQLFVSYGWGPLGRK